MPYEFIDLASPDLGKRLLKDAKGELPIDVWRLYVLHHDPNPPRADTRHSWSAPSVIGYCEEPYRSKLDPQKAVDEAHAILSRLFVRILSSSPPSSDAVLKGIQEADMILFRAHSSGRKRGHPKSMQGQAVRAYVIRKFNPDRVKTGESTVSWSKLADSLLNENGKCPTCRETRHQYDSPCVKALTTAERRLRAAMEHDGIPV